MIIKVINTVLYIIERSENKIKDAIEPMVEKAISEDEIINIRS